MADVPLEASVLGVEAARNFWDIGMHELQNRLQLRFAAAEICFADW